MNAVPAPWENFAGAPRLLACLKRSLSAGQLLFIFAAYHASSTTNR
jgi:hypothetical protein